MPTNAPPTIERRRRILGRVTPEEFFGRTDALEEIVSHASSRDQASRGMLVLATPSVGASELLRQAYDELFHRHENIVPIYFALSRNDRTSLGAASHFLHTFLLQLIAFRRHKPALSNASLTTGDLMELAAPQDYEWIERLIAACERERARGDERALIRLCFSAPERAAARGAHAMVMIDGLHVAEQLSGEVSLGAEIAQVFMRAEAPFVLSGLRRRLLNLIHDARGGFDKAVSLHLENLSEWDAHALVERLAERTGLSLNEEARDLIVQQFGGNPSLITSLMLAAQEKRVALDSFRNCQHLYVDELMGGRINRHYDAVLESVAPEASTRRALVRVLYEAMTSDTVKSSLESWRKKLDVSAEEFQRIMHGLHVHELISLNASVVQTARVSLVWQDYLRVRYRLEILAESRALVVADTLLETLKRAPQTMARHYRRASALGLRELLSLFNCQRVPASLLHYDRFSRAYKGAEAEEIHEGLENETELILLPQMIHAASGSAFHPPLSQVIDEERSAVAHGFDAGHYNDASEVVWIAAEIESKLEAGRGITEMWCDRLEAVARACGWTRVRLWLVAPEGFSAEASELLASREAYGSSRQQLELLTARVGFEASPAGRDESAPDEFEMVIPMGDETELIAASTVEQIARRNDFRPEEINQIKTALVEACINAMEHSLSPDQKIYQRFRLESDKLVITISSRGVVPPVSGGKSGTNGNGPGEEQAGKDPTERRGWGLKLIRTLMDEVEFERVDDGTRLRMTKYLRKQ
ncbi:MAG: ATP-binding protein [Acidobacteria bacterium]|nr:ATP-binding protein [Acidobacteriota bacterium]